MPLLDVAVLTAGEADLGRCLDAIYESLRVAGVNSQVYVCENGPIERRKEYDEIYSRFDGIRIVRNRENAGYPMGANRAIRAGNAPLCLFITDDVFIRSDCVSTLVRRMDDPTIGICGLKLIFPEDSPDPSRPAGKVQHVGHAMNIRGDIFHPFLGWDPNNPKCCVSRDVISVTGAAFIVRRKIFARAGGFFEGYGRGYFEDVDLCMTIRKMGHRVFIDTEAKGIHGVGTTFIKIGNKQPPPNIQNNRMLLQMRHGDAFAWTEFDMM